MRDKKKLLWTVFYADESSCENDFINVVASDEAEAKKTAMEDYRDQHGLGEDDTVDISIIDAFPVQEAWDSKGNKYLVTVKKV